MPAVTAKELKSVALSEDGQQITISIATKYVGDLEVTLPATELDALVNACSRLKPAPQQRAQPASSAARPAPTPAPAPAPAPAAAGTQVTVMVPKTWLVTADTGRQAVIIVFNHESDGRAGYALNTESSQKLAAALSKNATAVSQQVATQSAQPPR